MAMKTGENANKLLMYYQKNLKKKQQEATGQEAGAGDDIQNLQYRLYETSLHFVRSFTAQPTAENREIKGRIKYLLQRVFRKGTHYIFNQLVEKIFIFQSKSLEVSGQICGVLDKHDRRLEAYDDRLKAYDGRLEACDRQLKAYDGRLEAYEGQLRQAQQDIADRLNTLEVEIQKRNERIEALENDREYHANRLTALENGMWEQGNKILASENGHQDHDGRLITLENERKYHADRLTAIENWTWEYGNRFTSEEQERQSLVTDFKAIRQRVDELHAMLNSQTVLEFEIQKLKDRLDARPREKAGLVELQEAIIDDQIHMNKALTISEGRNIGFPSFSQCGEDGIINYLLFVVFKRDPSTIHYLDIGCNDFRKDNNTYYMYLLGAGGVVVDANPVCVETFRRNRPRDTVLNVGVGAKDEGNMVFYVMSNYGLSSFSRESVEDAIAKNPENRVEKEITVPVVGINTLLEKYFTDVGLDVLSIDAEGIDEKILAALDYEKYRPQIIIVETIEYAPWVVVEQKRDEIMDIMKQKGYIEFAFTGVNSIFIDPGIVR